MFLIYINIIPDNILSNIRHFGEDCIVYRKANSILDVQNDLNALNSWANNNRVRINERKNKSI